MKEVRNQVIRPNNGPRKERLVEANEAVLPAGLYVGEDPISSRFAPLDRSRRPRLERARSRSEKLCETI